METIKYSDIEIQTAETLLKEGYKWIVRYESGRLFAHSAKPSKVDTYWWSAGDSEYVCKFVPIFQSVRFGDKEPTSLESIVHPQILDDTEKRYLAGVIRPFRDEIHEIAKRNVTSGKYQWIDFIGKDEYAGFYLPNFKAGTMYKGMEVGRKYTLEELGL